MADLTIEISGENREQLARELREDLIADKAKVQIYSETEKGIDPLVIVSVALAGVQAAGVVWDWWRSRRSSETQVTIRTADGHVIKLSDIDRKQLEIVLSEE